MHSNWPGWLLIDKHKNKTGFPSTLDEDAELKNEIDLFYWSNFWFPINADRIQNQSMANSIFDFGVNAGIKTSVRLAQKIIGAEVDGIIGEQTLSRLNSFDRSHFLSAFIVAKITHYINLVKKRPANKKYLYGWIIRALSFND
jgi:lysozyme family protein